MSIDNIRSDTNFLINTSTSSYPDVDLIRNVNRHYDDVVSTILKVDGRWKWDDTNNTSQPIGNITMTEATTAVAIPDTTYLTINRVEVKDVNGNYYQLTPFNEREVNYQALSEFLKTPGRPLYYEKVGGYINLYPKPSSSNVTLTTGLRVYFQRDASYFLTSDTTKIPGFAAPFHRLLSMGAALDYAIANEMNGKVNMLTPMIQIMKSELMEFYSSRSRDESVRLVPRKEDYGAGDGFSTSNSDKAI